MPATPQSFFASLVESAPRPGGDSSAFASTGYDQLTTTERGVLEALCIDGVAPSCGHPDDLALLLLLPSALTPSAQAALCDQLPEHLAMGAGCHTLAARLRQDPWSLPAEVRQAMATNFMDLQRTWRPRLLHALTEPPMPADDFPAFLLALPQFETLAEALQRGCQSTSTQDAARRFMDSYGEWSSRPAPRRVAESAHRFGESSALWPSERRA